MTSTEDYLRDIAFYLEIIATGMVSHGDTCDYDLLDRILYYKNTIEDDTNGTNKP